MKLTIIAAAVLFALPAAAQLPPPGPLPPPAAPLPPVPALAPRVPDPAAPVQPLVSTPTPASPVEEALAYRFGDLDTDKSGQISLSELTIQDANIGPADLARYDTNGDKQLSRAEFGAFMTAQASANPPKLTGAPPVELPNTPAGVTRGTGIGIQPPPG